MRLLILLLMVLSQCCKADTIDHYIGIANQIPQMEIKADPQAQAWARSARNVLTITSESIAETLLEANEIAKKQGKPLFCLTPNTVLNAITLDNLIQQTYREISSQRADKDKMTVSQVAWLGVTKKFLCQKQMALNDLEQAFSNFRP